MNLGNRKTWGIAAAAIIAIGGVGTGFQQIDDWITTDAELQESLKDVKHHNTEGSFLHEENKICALAYPSSKRKFTICMAEYHRERLLRTMAESD